MVPFGIFGRNLRSARNDFAMVVYRQGDICFGGRLIAKLAKTVDLPKALPRERKPLAARRAARA